jgi:hypothetical protein
MNHLPDTLYSDTKTRSFEVIHHKGKAIVLWVTLSMKVLYNQRKHSPAEGEATAEGNT